MNLQQLREKAKQLIQENPDLKDDIIGFFSLAVSEIEEGGSEQHECELAYSDMMDLLEK
jgi:hypothetical protein